jgi:hypothetical protein
MRTHCIYSLFSGMQHLTDELHDSTTELFHLSIL